MAQTAPPTDTDRFDKEALNREQLQMMEEERLARKVCVVACCLCVRSHVNNERMDCCDKRLLCCSMGAWSDWLVIGVRNQFCVSSQSLVWPMI